MDLRQEKLLNLKLKLKIKNMPKIDRNGVEINYEVYGSGPPLFLTHGFSATSKMWDDQIDALSKYLDQFYQ